MSKNPEWFQQWRARGLCYICRGLMDDDDPRLAHRVCHNLSWRGYTAQQIRAFMNPRRHG